MKTHEKHYKYSFKELEYMMLEIIKRVIIKTQTNLMIILWNKFTFSMQFYDLLWMHTVDLLLCKNAQNTTIHFFHDLDMF